ncbi:enoyl-CoA hydratase/isomerase family protein [Sneathiella sp.]|uniref:enoyl-CoA hydratase/isomerase family protein n=1 Tax=Sneathiella sp. TaxID=1964365 RepID=UPI002638B5CC|nr:enoyl-CoA hydratase/isomerase family protein [Sneathiella sp.]MDF2368878.1 enoyl-CoA hydratase/isomerase family protein [Sneathiella sp.]
MPINEILEDGVKVITIDRPPMNAIDLVAIRSLGSLFKMHDPELPLVLEGSGKAFCAGVDVKAFASYSPEERHDMALAITDMTFHLLSIPGPVIAAVGGHALGGGLVLTLCTDYRVATNDGAARFGLQESRAGVPFPSGPERIIAREIPAPLRRHLTLSSQAVSSSFLANHMIFDELTSPEEIRACALARAKELNTHPGFRAVKSQIRRTLIDQVHQARDSGIEALFKT